MKRRWGAGNAKLSDCLVTPDRICFPEIINNSDMTNNNRKFLLKQCVEQENPTRLSNSEPPLGVWGNYRHLSRTDLARQSGVNRVGIIGIDAHKNAEAIATQETRSRQTASPSRSAQIQNLDPMSLTPYARWSCWFNLAGLNPHSQNVYEAIPSVAELP
jgi:hypothetical protein